MRIGRICNKNIKHTFIDFNLVPRFAPGGIACLEINERKNISFYRSLKNTFAFTVTSMLKGLMVITVF